MKTTLLLILITFPILLFCQTTDEQELFYRIADLRERMDQEKIQLQQLNSKINKLENNFGSLSTSLQDQIRHNLLLQAQNEKAVNLALDEFSEKFKAQNKTMDGVKESLDKQRKQQIFFFVVFLGIFIVLLSIGIKISTKKALKKQTQSWNEFNEYLLKR